ncbi:MAG: hemerythrin domain-containing protein [Acidobacteriota bacterium]|nr:hemerythrin domain-containing protein [Acidobacteriota bacterium]
MLATEILKQDHREAMTLIAELEGAESEDSGDSTSIEGFTKLDAALTLHMREEEEIFYPALIEYEEFSDLLSYSIPDHELVKEQLAQMGELEPESELFQEILSELKGALEAHVDNEEDDLFPEASEVLGNAKMEELGQEIENMKSESGMSQTAGM